MNELQQQVDQRRGRAALLERLTEAKRSVRVIRGLIATVAPEVEQGEWDDQLVEAIRKAAAKPVNMARLDTLLWLADQLDLASEEADYVTLLTR